MRVVKTPAIFTTATDPGCVVIRKSIFNGTGFANNIFKKNVFLATYLFFVLFSLQFHKAPTMLVLKICKQCINICFVSRVYNPMLSIRIKLTTACLTLLAIVQTTPPTQLSRLRATKQCSYKSR